MSATPAMVGQLRRMCNVEPSDTTWTQSVLAEYIQRYPLQDSDGNEPDDSDWTATYDLHSAAAEVWSEKASMVACQYDFSAYDGNFRQSQVYEQYKKQAAWHSARRAIGTIEAKPWPKPRPFSTLSDQPWVGNLPEPEELP